MTPLAQQVESFFWAAVAGGVLGMGVDLYRTLLRGRRRAWWWAIADLLMWLIGALIFFAFVQWSNRGQISVESVAGLVGGLVIYFRFASPEIRSFWEGITELIKFILRKLMRTLIWPFVMMARGWMWGRRQWKQAMGWLRIQVRPRWQHLQGWWRSRKRETGQWWRRWTARWRRPPQEPPAS
ncbi:spore cortex biosynthesis protein YabQ [Heliophilum fasciatum]|uniref:Spore cortex biosynthesis protein YabQ n=1 Tax=Heliophilum fasciatum TaxID=35700 RepID=A0A4R2S7Q8_9FIRM|nr:spore cortex biosynthesis protein YabQ [Heliophilum fasciatum]MCW2277033.1 spore cortex biosynthesis protein YabQ [Heliophilum fasciatum]TCP68441.1 spore cortex biosynthesis protein YabQ [Heliophilum fasciatum]